MTNNDVLRRIRYIFDYSDQKMLSACKLGNLDITREQLSSWLKKDIDPNYLNCSDINLASFLNGLIVDKRGGKDGVQPLPEKKLTNNIIFIKLKIALNLKSEDILEILSLSNFELSSHELSSFFRKESHKNHRECKDQVLRNFLKGLQLKYRGKPEPEKIINTSEKPIPEFTWKPLPTHKKQ
jgi:uncharacterized protein YehS (DUF1456 family)